MNIQSALNAPVYSRSVNTDRTPESSRGKYSMTEIMSKEKTAANAKVQNTSVVKERLSRGEIDGIADKLYTKYDPHFMLDEEYDRFLSDLTANGALTNEEAGTMGSWVRISSKPGVQNAQFEELALLQNPSIRGDTLLSLKLREAVHDKYHISEEMVKSNAYQKAISILEAIDERRTREGYHSTELLDRHFGIGSAEKREQLTKEIQSLKAALRSCYDRVDFNDGNVHLSTEIEDMMYSILDRARPKDSAAGQSYK